MFVHVGRVRQFQEFGSTQLHLMQVPSYFIGYSVSSQQFPQLGHEVEQFIGEIQIFGVIL